MERTIISHDTEAGTARIKFEHAGVTVEDDFILINIVPGTSYVFGQMGLEFTVDHQNASIEKLTRTITDQIDSGAIKNIEEPEPAPYSPPPASSPTVA